MSSKPLGKNTSQVEVTNISGHGIWILASRGEMFLAYDDFPWFKDALVSKILKVEELSPDHYYWPDLDVDLTAEIIEHPDRFPLTAK
ncbi:MAG: DUF2442 domain-containing protein [Pseudomonadales bacterium]|nr:DUF2442 domain-containing protein [Pseudomonadales bacterium]